MTETNEPSDTAPEPVDAPAPAPYDAGTPEAAPPPPPPPAPAPMAAPLAPMGGPADGPVGEIRSTGIGILLYIVTLSIYSWYWWYKTHDEMKRHTGYGVGGGVALLLAIFIPIVMVFLTSSEAGQLYERKGQPKPVSGMTGLWILLPLVGGIVWFVKTNGALNRYWESQGAVAS